MTDLNTIQQIEKNLKIKLTLKENAKINNLCYSVDSEGRVTSLILRECKINNLKKIQSLKKLDKLTHLDLGRNEIRDIDILESLTQLITLDLSNNKLTDITPLKDLQNLTNVDLASNLLTDIGPLEPLYRTRTLDLSQNNISDLNPLKSLRNLVHLSLRENKDLHDISPIHSLVNLVDLKLTDSSLQDIDAIENLTNIEILWLEQCNIKDLTPIENLRSLRELIIYNNPIKDLSFLEKLITLTFVQIVKSGLEDISIFENLHRLEILEIPENNIENVESLRSLRNLRRLDLAENKIRDISPLKELNNLQELKLQYNPIKTLPPWIVDFNMEINWEKFEKAEPSITFFENPLLTPPIEIVRQGRAALKRYFKKISVEGEDYIYEAKLTLVGEGNAGKTSLKRRLLNERAALPKKDKRTRGIEINDWKFKKEKGKVHIAHIWDFGGQDVYYPVHRFFITENSVFVLLASTRQTHHNFDYWIPTIYQFGGKSPIILGQTCDRGNTISWNDLGVYLGNPNFNVIKTRNIPYHEINLPNGNEGLKELNKP